ncbi:SUMO-interacting motif-containing protein 1 isoform X2 [Silurus meridionalis]|uniref:SUMO-interacting motif-containing protein 1 isoform X2 n=1 Tax=Silurus meridionalis TaxID=175797 RepID=UPI001EEC9B90|nr:SUMO-interacting motif-containing protein 1 isoform X2 [Silurus meridionalis]
MDDVISLSSGSEADSDIEFVSSSRDDSSSGFPFIRAELLPVTPVLIDITDHPFSSDEPRLSQRLKKLPCSTIEFIDLSSVSKSRVGITGKVQSSFTVNPEKDVICLESGDGKKDPQSPVPVSRDQEKYYQNQHNGVQSCLQDRRSVSHNSSPKDISLAIQSFGYQEFFEAQNTNQINQQSSAPAEKDLDHDKRSESPHSWLNEALSPFCLDSPYYCPSEIDEAVFSDESLILYDDGQKYTTCPLESPFEFGKSEEAQEKLHTLSCQTQLTPQTLPTSERPPEHPSPTSTELLAGDSPKTGSDLDIESPLISPSKSSYTLSSPLHLVSDIEDSVLQVSGEDDGDDEDRSEFHAEDGQQISLGQFKKLKHLLGGRRVQDAHTADEDNKQFGMAEPLCRQSLSLVYSTIEENYTEGTLQLLSDLIQPCYYPPDNILSHLLRGILLEPRCSQVQALEAYNLLMRTQRYHPADTTTIPWDWQLLSSAMSEQDESRRLRSEVRCLLLQYVLQVLEDDFQFKLLKLQLPISIANQMFSCDYRMSQVRELVTWLLDTAKQSFCTSEDEVIQKKERDCCLKMLLILQRMLLLAMEVDLRPTCSSSKLSEELCNILNSMAPCRRLRILLLSTLQSNLLRCKMVELLLDRSSSQKRVLPMSFNLLLHFLRTSTPALDPSDGTERWRRWDELLQLVWMLMISYQEVISATPLRSALS